MQYPAAIEVTENEVGFKTNMYFRFHPNFRFFLEGLIDINDICAERTTVTDSEMVGFIKCEFSQRGLAFTENEGYPMFRKIQLD